MIHILTEMSLYLAAAAFVGLITGWLIWGLGWRRDAAKTKAEMATKIEKQQNFAAKAREALRESDEKQALALSEMEQLLAVEKKETLATQEAFTQLRLELDDANQAKNTLQDALRNTESLTLIAHEAEIREKQTRVELEESRLMVGTEKLAAQSAHAELIQLRQEFQKTLDAERKSSYQARKALNGIRVTLIQTFGDAASFLTKMDLPSDREAPKTVDQFKPLETSLRINNDSPLDEIAPASPSPSLAAFNIPNDAEPETAPAAHYMTAVSSNAPEANSAEAEHNGTSSPNADDRPKAAEISAEQQNGSNVEPLKPLPQPDRHEADDEVPSQSPSNMDLVFDAFPGTADNLQSIEGIDAQIEQSLNDQGFNRIDQLAHLSEHDIDRLCQGAKGIPDLRERIVRDKWSEQAKALQSKNDIHSTTEADKPRWTIKTSRTL